MEIFFADLNEEVQNRVLKFYKISSPEELNYDIVPIIILERGDVKDEMQ